MAKLVDALPSGGSVRKDVLVRIQSRALVIFKNNKNDIFKENNRAEMKIADSVIKVFSDG